jgi:hypothetical protein
MTACSLYPIKVGKIMAYSNGWMDKWWIELNKDRGVIVGESEKWEVGSGKWEVGSGKWGVGGELCRRFRVGRESRALG